MKTIFIRFCLLYPIFFFQYKLVCGQQIKIDTTILRIDPNYSQGAMAAQVFGDIKFIPLEDGKESTFDQLYDLQISKHYLVFYDQRSYTEYIFTREGKFSGKITALPTKMADAYIPSNTKGRYLPGNFVLDKNSENVYIVYPENNKSTSLHLAVYNAKGVVLESKTLNGNLNNKLAFSFAFLDGSKEVFSYNPHDPTAVSYFSIVQNFDSIIAHALPLNQSTHPSGNKKFQGGYNSLSMTGNNSIWSNILDYNYRVLYFNHDATAGLYQFIFPAAITLDSSFYKNQKIVEAKMKMASAKTKEDIQATYGLLYNYLYDYFDHHADKVNQISGVFKSKDFLLFSITQGGYNTMKINSYIYSFASSNLYAQNRIVSDSSACFMPLFSNQILGMDEDGNIYLSVPSYQMFDAYERNKGKHPKYPLVLQKYFATQSRKSNPVIVRLTPKANL